MEPKNNLTEGPITSTLIRLTLPLIAGYAASFSFNLADALFVAQLGTLPLAAMSFTFPVAVFVISVSVGLSMGAAAVISVVYGKQDMAGVRRLATATVLLSLLISLVFIAVGFLTVRPLFTALGADQSTLVLIERFILLWYAGIPTILVTMTASSAIRATGDTKNPGLIMVAGSVINVILDPIFIFGLFGFPRLEIFGAALATVISQSITLVFTLYIFHRRHRLLSFSWISPRALLASWRQILVVGIPTTATSLLFPVTMAFVTWLASRFGPEGVAAVGAGLRVESLAFMMVIGLSAALVPFVGQNWGALRFARVYDAQRAGNRITFIWGFFSWVVFVIFSHPIARLFSADETVIRYIVDYLWIMPAGLAMQGVFQLISGTFNAIGRPLVSATLNAGRVFFLYIPLGLLGATMYGFPGFIGGIAATNIVTGGVAIFLFARVCVHDEACIKDGRKAVPKKQPVI